MEQLEDNHYYVIFIQHQLSFDMNINKNSEMNEFSNSNKNREKAGKEIAPIIEKIEAEFTLVLSEARTIKEKANDILKFQCEKLALEKYIKQLRRDVHETNSHIATIKAEGQLANSKQSSSLTTLKDQLHSLERTINRREDYFQNYDRKLNNIMDTLSKHQAYINDRMFVFQQKFKQLTKETLQMTKEVKKDFEHTMSTNLMLKNQLVHKIKHTQEKEKILDLYMSEREEIPKKLKEIYEDLRNCLRQNQFQEFKNWHQSAIEESLSKAKSMVERIFPPNSQDTLKAMEKKINEIDAMKVKFEQIDEVKQQIQEVNMKIDQLQKNQDHKLTKFRQETQEIEEKIIEVIDKKIETIEEEIENYNIQNEESIQEKLEKMKEYLISLIQQSHQKSEYSSIQKNSQGAAFNMEEHASHFATELTQAKKERELITQHSRQIRELAEGLQGKLILFSNRITMCRSDVEIFIENSSKQLKKILDLRKDEQSHMEQVGRMFADIMESLLMLTSLSINEQAAIGDHKSFVTFRDGIILQREKGSLAGTLSYRRFQATPLDFKQSLLFALMNEIDNQASGQSIFKWDQYKPSAFFSKVRENLMLKSKKGIMRSPSDHIHSPRKTKRSVPDGEEDLLFDLKMESEQLSKNSTQKPKIAINNSTLLLTSEKPKSQMQIRYKLKKMEEKIKKDETQRNCFTASRSHRKTKISFN